MGTTRGAPRALHDHATLLECAVRVTGISILRIEDGKVIESSDLVDRVSRFRQVGFEATPPKN
jgi:hypothetical protein